MEWREVSPGPEVTRCSRQVSSVRGSGAAKRQSVFRKRSGVGGGRAGEWWKAGGDVRRSEAGGVRNRWGITRLQWDSETGSSTEM